MPDPLFTTEELTLMDTPSVIGAIGNKILANHGILEGKPRHPKYAYDVVKQGGGDPQKTASIGGMDYTLEPATDARINESPTNSTSYTVGTLDIRSVLEIDPKHQAFPSDDDLTLGHLFNTYGIFDDRIINRIGISSTKINDKGSKTTKILADIYLHNPKVLSNIDFYLFDTRSKSRKSKINFFDILRCGITVSAARQGFAIEEGTNKKYLDDGIDIIPDSLVFNVNEKNYKTLAATLVWDDNLKYKITTARTTTSGANSIIKNVFSNNTFDCKINESFNLVWRKLRGNSQIIPFTWLTNEVSPIDLPTLFAIPPENDPVAQDLFAKLDKEPSEENSKNYYLHRLTNNFDIIKSALDGATNPKNGNWSKNVLPKMFELAGYNDLKYELGPHIDIQAKQFSLSIQNNINRFHEFVDIRRDKDKKCLSYTNYITKYISITEPDIDHITFHIRKNKFNYISYTLYFLPNQPIHCDSRNNYVSETILYEDVKEFSRDDIANWNRIKGSKAITYITENYEPAYLDTDGIIKTMRWFAGNAATSTPEGWVRFSDGKFINKVDGSPIDKLGPDNFSSLNYIDSKLYTPYFVYDTNGGENSTWIEVIVSE